METQPVDGIEDHQSGETPEDVAILYSWANLQGAKYRDFSANRREYRAQMRHRAAEQLRLMELKAQSEAEAAAAQAEAEAAAAHAEADAATARLATSRSMAAIAPEEVQAENEVEFQRRSSLREAAQQARRAAAERLEAARRAEAAALADSIARREEREIAEAQASALRQAAQYAESDQRGRNIVASEKAIPGRISDPYSPQILAEGEYFENPGTPIAELAANRFRNQREYIERATGAELPPFRMPVGFNEDGAQESKVRPADVSPRRNSRDWFDDEEPVSAAADFSPRRLSDLNLEDRDIRDYEIEAERRARRDRNVRLPIHPVPDAPARDAARRPMPPIPDRQYAQTARNGANPGRAEVVNRIPGVESEPFLYKSDGRGYDGEYSGSGPQQFLEDFKEFPEELLPKRHAESELTFQPGPRRESPQNTRQASDHGIGRFEKPYDLPADQGRDLRKGREAVPFDGYPGTNLGFPPPYTQPEQLYRPDTLAARPAHRGDEQDGGRRQSPRPPLANEYWSDALNQSDPGAREAIHSQLPVANAPPPSARPDPEWLEAKNARPDTQPGGPKLREEYREVADTLQSSRERVASRWFALKEVFSHPGSARPQHTPVAKETNKKTPIIAVLSMAGGVGKTSLVATLGRTLSSLGENVLLADTTSHGLLPFYFGASELLPGVIRTFLPPSGSADAPIHLVSYGTGLCNDKKSQGEVTEDLLSNSQRAHRVLMDLDVNCRWLVERVARLQSTFLVPLSADMNSVISLQSVERNLGSMQDAEGEPLRPLYMLNQFNPSSPLHLDVREVLRQQLGDRLLPLVIRQATGVSEALAEGMTIVDYEPESVAVQDYLGLANWIRARSAPTNVGFRNLRWSER